METPSITRITQYSAIVEYSEMNNPKNINTPFCIIGSDESDILEKAKKYGKDGKIVSKLKPLNKDWDVILYK